MTDPHAAPTLGTRRARLALWLRRLRSVAVWTNIAVFCLIFLVVDTAFNDGVWSALRLAGILFAAWWLGQNWSALPRWR